MSTKFAKTLLWEHDYDVKLWRHKQRTPNTNVHHMPLNETTHKNFCVRHCDEQQVETVLHISELTFHQGFIELFAHH